MVFMHSWDENTLFYDGIIALQILLMLFWQKFIVWSLNYDFMIYKELLPLVLTFEIPLGGRLPLDASSPAIQRIAQSCNVTINFKQVSVQILF